MPSACRLLQSAPAPFSAVLWVMPAHQVGLFRTDLVTHLVQKRRPAEGCHHRLSCPPTFYPRSFQIRSMEAMVTPAMPAGPSGQGAGSIHDIQSPGPRPCRGEVRAAGLQSRSPSPRGKHGRLPRTRTVHSLRGSRLSHLEPSVSFSFQPLYQGMIDVQKAIHIQHLLLDEFGERYTGVMSALRRSKFSQLINPR